MREEKVSPQSGPIMPYTLTSGPVLLIAAIVVASFIFALYGKYQSRPKTWTVVGCSIVKDDRVREGESVRLKLSGPTFIEAQEFATECVIPIGTEFTDYRVGGNICATAELSKRLPSGSSDCFRIMSETKR